MSDYAGPILGVVGAIIGSFVPGVGTALGWSIGYALGSVYAASQQVLPGPKIGDVQKQTSQEGGYRPIIYGRSHPIMGNVIADGGPVIVKKEESQGKGGPKVETEYAYRTYAVGMCEGESILMQAWRNGILVYNREDPSMAAENAKFLGYATWYTGAFDQMPDPDLQAIYGAGNTPAFRGTSYLVLANEDVTDQRGAWSQWQVRVFRGAAKLVTTPPYVMEDVVEMKAAAMPSELANVLPPSFKDNVGVTSSPIGIENRLMRKILEVEMANVATTALPLEIENRQMRQVEEVEMADIGVSATPSAIANEQIRVVLDNSQITEMNVSATPQGIEVIVP